MFTLELTALATVLAIAFVVAEGSADWLHRLGRRFRRLARHRRLAVLFVGLLAFALTAAVGLLGSLRVPDIHDEFSYLVAADTFAHGRLTNPPHPMWEHFETYHVIFQPSYQSKYPPGQGLMLALGQVLTGKPIVGAWISVALACAAICWMLQGWMPPHWALLGGIFTATNWAIIEHWGETYWGGAVAMFGGALLFGALRRTVRRPRVRTSVVMGLGLAVLANSRPFEGLVACLPAAVVLLVWTVRQLRRRPRVILVRFLLPLLAVLALAGGWMGYYHYRVTGNPLVMPYQKWHETYAAGSLTNVNLSDNAAAARPPRPQFLKGLDWLKPLSPDPLLNTLYNIPGKLKVQWLFYLGPTLTVPLVLMLPWTLRNRWMWFALATCVLVLAALVIQDTKGYPHYTAPMAGLIMVLVLQSFRHLSRCRLGDRPVGLALVALLPVVYLASQAGGLYITERLKTGGGAWQWAQERARIQEKLERKEGRHLVIVRYGPKHNELHEWVYNKADIDAAKVVWARELGDSRDRKLREYFKGRHVWLVEADAEPPRLLPYPGP
jgi:hypothetical protein